MRHLRDGFGQDAICDHVAHELLGYFLQDFLSEEDRVLLELVELYELNDIPACLLSSAVSEDHVVAIKLPHVSEIGITNANYDDTQRILGTFHDQVLSSGHVMDLSIGEDQENVIHGRLNVRLHVLEDGVEDGGEVGWSQKACALNGSLIELKDLGNALDRGVLLTIQVEAMVNLV